MLESHEIVQKDVYVMEPDPDPDLACWDHLGITCTSITANIPSPK